MKNRRNLVNKNKKKEFDQKTREKRRETEKPLNDYFV